MSVRNSSLVLAWSRKQPSMVLVTVVAPDFWTPRIDMHMWLSERPDQSSDGHTIMREEKEDARGFHDDGHAPGLDGLLDGDGDLLGEALLNLEPAREGLCDASELGETENQLVGDVSDVDLRR